MFAASRADIVGATRSQQGCNVASRVEGNAAAARGVGRNSRRVGGWAVRGCSPRAGRTLWAQRGHSRVATWRAGRRVRGGCAWIQGQPPPKAAQSSPTGSHTGVFTGCVGVIPRPYYFTGEEEQSRPNSTDTIVNATCIYNCTVYICKWRGGRHDTKSREDNVEPKASQQGETFRGEAHAPPFTSSQTNLSPLGLHYHSVTHTATFASGASPPRRIVRRVGNFDMLL